MSNSVMTEIKLRVSSEGGAKKWAEKWGLKIGPGEEFHVTDHLLKLPFSDPQPKTACVFYMDQGVLILESRDEDRDFRVNQVKIEKAKISVGDSIEVGQWIRIEVLKAPGPVVHRINSAASAESDGPTLVMGVQTIGGKLSNDDTKKGDDLELPEISLEEESEGSGPTPPRHHAPTVPSRPSMNQKGEVIREDRSPSLDEIPEIGGATRMMMDSELRQADSPAPPAAADFPFLVDADPDQATSEEGRALARDLQSRGGALNAPPPAPDESGEEFMDKPLRLVSDGPGEEEAEKGSTSDPSGPSGQVVGRIQSVLPASLDREEVLKKEEKKKKEKEEKFKTFKEKIDRFFKRVKFSPEKFNSKKLGYVSGLVFIGIVVVIKVLLSLPIPETPIIKLNAAKGSAPHGNEASAQVKFYSQGLPLSSVIEKVKQLAEPIRLRSLEKSSKR